jgi:hypothetical protein
VRRRRAPAQTAQSATAQYGCLIVLDPTGRPVSTIPGANIQGPWDMTAVTHGSDTTMFVSMVLNGGAKEGVKVVKNSTVLRITLTSGPGQAPKVLSQQVVANAIPWRDDPSALAIGPTGKGTRAAVKHRVHSRALVLDPRGHDDRQVDHE